MRGDAKLVREAVGQDSMALQFASTALRSQRDLVLAAVVGHGHSLQFASDELKEDLILEYSLLRCCNVLHSLALVDASSVFF